MDRPVGTRPRFAGSQRHRRVDSRHEVHARRLRRGVGWQRTGPCPCGKHGQRNGKRVTIGPTLYSPWANCLLLRRTARIFPPQVFERSVRPVLPATSILGHRAPNPRSLRPSTKKIWLPSSPNTPALTSFARIQSQFLILRLAVALGDQVGRFRRKSNHQFRDVRYKDGRVWPGYPHSLSIAVPAGDPFCFLIFCGDDLMGVPIGDGGGADGDIGGQRGFASLHHLRRCFDADRRHALGGGQGGRAGYERNRRAAIA